MAGRRWAVLEHVAKVSVAASAMNLGAGHEEAGVDAGFNSAGQWLEKARPSGAAIELGRRTE